MEKIEEKHVTTELILESGREQKGTTIKTMEEKQTTEAISDSENKLKDPPHSEINNIKGTENEILHIIKLNESNITDNRKERKKVRKVTYSDVVKENASEKIVNLEEIRAGLLSGSSSQHSSTSPPVLCCDISKNINSSDQLELNEQLPGVGLSSQDDEFLRIVEDLPKDKLAHCNSNCSEESRSKGYFCSDTVFNLSSRALSEDEIRVLKKELDFAPIQRKVNEPELRRDFEDFCKKMRIKWHFRNDLSEDFSQIPAYRPKSAWKPPIGHPNLEVFLSCVEHEIFKDIETPLRYSNLTSEEWRAILSLADDRDIVIKKTDKGSAVVVWDRNDYVKEAEKQLKDTKVYKQVDFKEKLLCELYIYI